MTGAASPSLRLPRSEALTSELLAEGGPVVSEAVIVDLRRSLPPRLVELVAELPSGVRLTLDSYHLKMALQQPETCGQDEDGFLISPRVCRRAIGLAAVQRCVRGHCPAPAAAVDSVLAESTDGVGPDGDPGRPPWWAQWYGSLSAGGRAVVAAEAVMWATQLWTAFDWNRIAPLPVIGGRDDWWDCPGAKELTFKGRVEVRAFATDRRPVMAVVQGGAPGAGWLPMMGFPALVAGLIRGPGAVPSRVVGLWPASGQVRILPVDEAVITETAQAVTSAAEVWVEGYRHALIA